MKKVGEIIKRQRLSQNKSLEEIESITKIKKEFIDAIENGSWKDLPDFAVVLGFSKRISQVLNLDERKIVALLKRDYPPEKQKIDLPQKELKEEKKIGPAIFFAISIFLFSFMFVSYLIVQYINFNKPPKLFIDTPIENEVLKSLEIQVKGKTDPFVSLKINSQPFIVKEDGSFEGELTLSKDSIELLAVAKTRSGKETVLKRKIILELK